MTGKFNKIKFLKGLTALTISTLCAMIHIYCWLLYTDTFVSKLLLWVMMIFFSWLTARMFNRWITRLFDDTNNIFLHMGVTLLLFSWIPFAGLVATNYFLADKATYEVTLPVAVRDYEHIVRTDRKAPYVKIKHGLYKKFFYVIPNDIPVKSIDSIKLRLSKGYLGFEVIRSTEFICH